MKKTLFAKKPGCGKVTCFSAGMTFPAETVIPVQRQPVPTVFPMWEHRPTVYPLNVSPFPRCSQCGNTVLQCTCSTSARSQGVPNAFPCPRRSQGVRKAFSRRSRRSHAHFFRRFVTLKFVSDPCQYTNRKRTGEIDLFRIILGVKIATLQESRLFQRVIHILRL